MKKFSLLIMLFLISASFARSATINVPGDYADIQAAIDNANNNDIIHISAGDYYTSTQYTVNKILTIEGEGDATVIHRQSPGSYDYTFNFGSDSDGSTLKDMKIIGEDGFTGPMDGSNYTHGYVIIINDGADGVTIDNITFEHGRSAVLLYADDGIVQNCRFFGYWLRGLVRPIGASNALITGNIDDSFHYQFGLITVDGDFSGEISYNYLASGENPGWFKSTGNVYDMEFYSDNYTGQVLITHNTFDTKRNYSGTQNTSGNYVRYAAIYFEGSPASGDIDITDNIFEGYNKAFSGSSSDNYCIYAPYNFVTVDNNLYYENDVTTWSPTPPDANAIYSDPQFERSGTALDDYYALQAGSPAIGTASDATNVGAWQGGTIIKPVHNVTQDLYYNDIQSAVNDANPGDTIEADDGTYNENVIIDKDVTLVSVNGRSTTAIVGSSGGSGLGTIQVNSGNQVQIGDAGKGFKIVGYDGPTAGLEHAAVYFKGNNSNSIVKDNELIADGEACLLTEYGGTVDGLVIDNNIFSGKTFVGPNPAGDGFGAQFSLMNVPRSVIYISGGTKQNIDFTNNTISAISGGCSITDNNGNSTAPHEQGNTQVTLDGDNITITGNSFSGFTARYATALRARGTTATYTISGNTFDGINPGYFYAQNDATGQARAQDVYNNNTFGDPGTTLFESSVYPPSYAIACGCSEVAVDDDWTGISYGQPVWFDGTYWVYGVNAFDNIQDGVDAVCNSTVYVAPGYYAPSSTIDLNVPGLKLIGPQADIDPRPSYGSSRTAGSADEAIIDGQSTLGTILYISADNVEINGFEIKSGTGDMVHSDSPVTDGAYCAYNIIHNGMGDEGIQLKHATNSILEYNYVFDIGYAGDALNLSSGSTNGIIRYNEAKDIGSANAAIYSYGSDGILILGNLINGTTDNDGIKVRNSGGGSNATIKCNIILNTVQDGISIDMDDVLVEDNIVTGSTSENGAVYIYPDISNVTVRHNIIYDNNLSLTKANPAGIKNRSDNTSTIHINFNSIYGNTPYGIYNDAAGTIDAEYNWWGDCSGPDDDAGLINGSGDAISINIDADPWIGNNAFGSPSVWFTPVNAKRHGDDMLADLNARRIGDERLSSWLSADCGEKEATQDEEVRQPKYKCGGWVGFDSFFDVNAEYSYGLADIMQMDYYADVTTDETSRWEPSTTNKDLFLTFKTGDNVDEGPADPVYYRDGRQTLFEAGGPLSGYVVYIMEGRLVFGAWNRFEKKYTILEEASFYPLDPNQTYYGHFAYDGTSFMATASDGNTNAQSDPIPFQGLTKDGSDVSGIGGAARTRYHDYATGETYSDEFHGCLGDILLYDGNELADQAAVEEYFNARYGVPALGGIPKLANDRWRVVAITDITDGVGMSTAYPNPFTNTAKFGIELPMQQNVTVELLNTAGSKVQSIYAGTLGKGFHEFTIDGSNLTSGAYIYRISGEGFVKSGKVILSK